MPCSAAVVWLHGMGDTEVAWKVRFQNFKLATVSTSCMWIHPLAPSGSVTYYGGQVVPRWCDTRGDAASTSWIDDVQDVAESISVIHTLVESLEVQPDHVVIGGHSQGAAIALLAAITYPKRLAGCMILSGWLSFPFAEQVRSHMSASSCNGAMPIWWGHGRHDTVIPFCLQKENCSFLDSLRPLPVEQHEYDFGHEPTDDAIQDLLLWLRQLLPEEEPTSQCARHACLSGRERSRSASTARVERRSNGRCLPRRAGKQDQDVASLRKVRLGIDECI